MAQSRVQVSRCGESHLLVFRCQPFELSRNVDCDTIGSLVLTPVDFVKLSLERRPLALREARSKMPQMNYGAKQIEECKQAIQHRRRIVLSNLTQENEETGLRSYPKNTASDVDLPNDSRGNWCNQPVIDGYHSPRQCDRRLASK